MATTITLGHRLVLVAQELGLRVDLARAPDGTWAAAVWQPVGYHDRRPVARCTGPTPDTVCDALASLIVREARMIMRAIEPE